MLELSYIVPNFEYILESCFEALDKIWPNKYNIFKFWCIKHAENPRKAREVDETKDAYDRQDNYDAQGVAVFTYAFFKKQIDSVFESPKQQISLKLDPLSFQNYHRYQFFLEASLPAINFLIQQSLSHANSETLKQIGLELTTFLLYMSEQEGCRYPTLGHFTKDDDGVLVLVSNLF